MPDTVSFTLNGKPVNLTVDGDRALLWVLRTDLELTGTKFGCGKGFCGACTVLVDGKPVRSCHFPVKDAAGKAVTTIEGLARDGKLAPVQAAFVEHDALQCGFCTPGIILKSHSFLTENPKPTREDIVKALDNHLCRCGAHKRIVEAVEAAAQFPKGGGQS
jgi:aerobic-type carbon monoxide dehydrogenase small subunit (CoxS/CutS family)